jgi:hypothetical protein
MTVDAVHRTPVARTARTGVRAPDAPEAEALRAQLRAIATRTGYGLRALRTMKVSTADPRWAVALLTLPGHQPMEVLLRRGASGRWGTVGWGSSIADGATARADIGISPAVYSALQVGIGFDAC